MYVVFTFQIRKATWAVTDHSFETLIMLTTYFNTIDAYIKIAGTCQMAVAMYAINLSSERLKRFMPSICKENKTQTK